MAYRKKKLKDEYKKKELKDYIFINVNKFCKNNLNLKKVKNKEFLEKLDSMSYRELIEIYNEGVRLNIIKPIKNIKSKSKKGEEEK